MGYIPLSEGGYPAQKIKIEGKNMFVHVSQRNANTSSGDAGPSKGSARAQYWVD